MNYFADNSEISAAAPADLMAGVMADLMAAQCDDLEKLMYLMRREAEIRSSSDIDSISCMVLKKDLLIRRIETSRRRIAQGMK